MIMENRELPTVYDPQSIEQKWYNHWLNQKSFKPVPSQKGTYSIIMPPPNVTGKLHIGHALDQTCQDILVRFKRMQGYETLWIPGYDHAGISTQAVVEKKVYLEEKKTKHEVGREAFVQKIWEWKEEYGGEIVNQLKRIGISCDWDYFSFTMDRVPNLAVNKVFTELYNEGLIYQADYIVNWDPILQSAISDAEVEHKEVQGHFYYIKYFLNNSDEFLTVATTRPETLFGDTAVAVNPNDERFEQYIGKDIIVPLTGRTVKVIADDYVDIEKGTGCLKVTPGHDFNDFEIGKRHNLETINILNKDGTLNHNASVVEGLSAKKARNKAIELLTEADLLIKTETHTHQVGHGERSGEIIEPMVSKQWFLNVNEMARQAVEAVENSEMTFYPKGWENTYFSWLKSPRDWCISRQLWWGHQIPIFNCHQCHHQWASEEKASECPKCQDVNISQDPDVLDTWFSSGLWPLSTLGWPDEEAMAEKGFDRFYPTSTLVTGFDIIFFWVARMMMMGIKASGKSPFEKVYIHAIVRDKLGRKMSKSLGNGIDPLDIISTHGADALRFSLAAGSGYNRNLNLDPENIEGYRNFINKIWNAYRFLDPFLELAGHELPEMKSLDHHDRWILSELSQVTSHMTKSIDDFRFDDACQSIYSFVYDRFCSWYIEIAKVTLYGDDELKKAYKASVLKHCFREIVTLLHPFIPHFTEELWSFVKNVGESDLISRTYPVEDTKFNFEQDTAYMNKFIETVTLTRNLRSSVNIKPKEEIKTHFFTDDAKWAEYLYNSKHYLLALAKVSTGEIKDKASDRPHKSIMGATAYSEIFIPLEGVIDLSEQIARIEKEIGKAQKEEEKLLSKLNNDKFISNAPSEVIEEVKLKAKEFSELRISLEENLKLFL